MKCTSCGHENSAAGKFCGECGARLVSACPSCRAEIRGDQKFCGECGRDLRPSADTRPVDYAKPRSYTPQHLQEKILTTRSALEGERKLVTVLFADVANYTSLTEKLDPEEVHVIMDGCFRILMDQIHKREGTINQFTGDGVMALFGAPVAHEDHAQRACDAALAIQSGISRYSERIRQDYGLDFRMRIGLNSGLVVVASIGDDLRMDYTAVGDTTNLAARLQALAEPGSVLVSAGTHRIVSDYFDLEPLGKRAIKGKEQPQEVYVLVRTGEAKSRIAASIAKGLTPFVGRGHELSAVREAWEKAASGSGQVVAIVGEAGVGKSRLLLELRGALQASEYTYLEGRCVHFGSSMPYLPILDLIRQNFQLTEGGREYEVRKTLKERLLSIDPQLGGILAPLEDLLSLKVEDEAYAKLEPKRKKERTFEAIRDLFLRMSQARPLVIALEDLHWMDPTSRELLDYLIGWLANSPTLLLLLYRPEFTHPWASRSYYRQVNLTQLSTQSSAELMSLLMEGAAVAPEVQELILRRTGGNPFFIEELTHSLLENGVVAKEDRGYVLSRSAADVGVPDTIQGIVAARIDRLDQNIKRTMQVASVIGREFAFQLLQVITGMREELKNYLLNLQGLEFVYEKKLFPELEYMFKHMVTQEVAYNSLLVQRRKELHEKTAAAIEQIYSERLEEFYEMLAYHFAKGESWEKAAQYSKLAGLKAVRKHLPGDAIRCYGEALQALERLPPSPRVQQAELEVCLLTFPPAMVLSFPEGCLETLERGERLAQQLGHDPSLVQAYNFISMCHMFKGNGVQAAQYGEKALNTARKLGTLEVVVPTVASLCTAYSRSFHFTRIQEIAPDALEQLEKAGRLHDFFGQTGARYPVLCAIYGYALGGLGEFERGEGFCAKGIEEARRLGNLQTLALAEAYVNLFHLTRADGPTVEAHSRQLIELGQRAKWDQLIGYGQILMGCALALLGNPAGAIEAERTGMALLRKANVEHLLSMGCHCLATSLLTLGRNEEATAAVREGLQLAKKCGETGHEGVLLIDLGRCHAEVASSAADDAEASMKAGIQILESLKVSPWFSQGYLHLGRLYAARDRKDAAREWLRKADANFRRMGMHHWAGRTEEVLESVA